jgi:hypothetical protein
MKAHPRVDKRDFGECIVDGGLSFEFGEAVYAHSDMGAKQRARSLNDRAERRHKLSVSEMPAEGVADGEDREDGKRSLPCIKDEAAAAPIPAGVKNRATVTFWRGNRPRKYGAVFSKPLRGRSFSSFRNKPIQVLVLSLYANQMCTTKCGPAE